MRDFEETSTQQHWAWSLKGVIAIASFYGLLHGLFRGLSSPVIGQDDVIANVYVQTLEGSKLTDAADRSALRTRLLEIFETER